MNRKVEMPPEQLSGYLKLKAATKAMKLTLEDADKRYVTNNGHFLKEMPSGDSLHSLVNAVTHRCLLVSKQMDGLAGDFIGHLIDNGYEIVERSVGERENSSEPATSDPARIS